MMKRLENFPLSCVFKGPHSSYNEMWQLTFKNLNFKISQENISLTPKNKKIHLVSKSNTKAVDDLEIYIFPYLDGNEALFMQHLKSVSSRKVFTLALLDSKLSALNTTLENFFNWKSLLSASEIEREMTARKISQILTIYGMHRVKNKGVKSTEIGSNHS